ncbi:hypothetical protein VNO78_04877 [Psophocarpus tetragonolobus]|uniref:Uncharacterized protein n=1 Tax=Psophocarpus tetragonolobus TaxID=3891 RepID=A0AAN9XWI6_PSOTE
MVERSHVKEMNGCCLHPVSSSVAFNSGTKNDPCIGKSNVAGNQLFDLGNMGLGERSTQFQSNCSTTQQYSMRRSKLIQFKWDHDVLLTCHVRPYPSAAELIPLVQRILHERSDLDRRSRKISDCRNLAAISSSIPWVQNTLAELVGADLKFNSVAGSSCFTNHASVNLAEMDFANSPIDAAVEGGSSRSELLFINYEPVNVKNFYGLNQVSSESVCDPISNEVTFVPQKSTSDNAVCNRGLLIFVPIVCGVVENRPSLGQKRRSKIVNFPSMKSRSDLREVPIHESNGLMARKWELRVVTMRSSDSEMGRARVKGQRDASPQ